MIPALRRGVRPFQNLLPRAGPGVAILAYHLVGAGSGSPVDLPSPVFRRQMEELARAGSVVTLEEAVRRLAAGTLPDGAARVVLTFDDAYRNFATHAHPVLAELGLPATLYVPTGFLDGTFPAPLGGGLEPLAWDELREVVAGGLVTAGSHTHTHPDLRRLREGELCRELELSRRILEERLDRPVEHFAYPRALWSRHLEARVGEIYRTAAVAGGRLNRPDRTRSLRLSRLPVRADMPASLGPLLARPVWLEEWVADRWRRWRA